MVIIEKLMSLFPRGAKPQTETPETFGGDPRNNADQIWVDGKIAAIADREGGYAEFHRELRRWDAAMRGERAYIEE